MEDTWEQFSAVVRSMSSSEDLGSSMESAVAGAVQIIPHAHYAGISMVHGRRRIETPAVTDPVARRGDELQYEVAEGPCLQSIHQEETVQSDDLATERRWPAWSRRVVEELGVRSMLCFQLFVTEDTLGALNLYSRTPRAFTADDRTTGLALAAHVAVALASAHQIENLESAIVNRTLIGQAQGMLMQRYELSPAGAFAVLARVSQHTNRRLHNVAAELVENGITTGFHPS